MNIRSAELEELYQHNAAAVVVPPAPPPPSDPFPLQHHAGMGHGSVGAGRSDV